MDAGEGSYSHHGHLKSLNDEVLDKDRDEACLVVACRMRRTTWHRHVTCQSFQEYGFETARCHRAWTINFKDRNLLRGRD